MRSLRNRVCGVALAANVSLSGCTQHARESGTRKDVVASAISYSKYIPFDPESGTFAADPYTGFLAANVTAFHAGTVESVLFGHRGAALAAFLVPLVFGGW